MVDGNGYEVPNGHIKFNSFGNPVSSAPFSMPYVDFLFGMDGMRWDPATKEYRTAARVYDPAAGRFDSQDPITTASGTTNFYAWCGNDPVGQTDPSGMCSSAVTVSPSTYFTPSGLGDIGLTPGNSVAQAYSPLVWSPGGFVGTLEGAASDTSRRRSHRPPSHTGKRLGEQPGGHPGGPRLTASCDQSDGTGRQHGPADGNDLSHVPVSAINGIRDTYAGTVDYTEVSPNTLAGAGWGSPTTKAVVSVPWDSGTTAYTFHLVQPLLDSAYYELENTQAEATPGETIRRMRDGRTRFFSGRLPSPTATSTRC